MDNKKIEPNHGNFYLDDSELNNLEDLALYLSISYISLNLICKTQKRSIELGIMSDELNERAKLMIWDIKRMLKSHETQLKAVLELVSDDFEPDKLVHEKREIMKKKVVNK